MMSTEYKCILWSKAPCKKDETTHTCPIYTNLVGSSIHAVDGPTHRMSGREV